MGLRYGIRRAQGRGPRVYGNNTTLLETAVSLLPMTCPEMWSTVATFLKLGVSTQAMCCPP